MCRISSWQPVVSKIRARSDKEGVPGMDRGDVDRDVLRALDDRQERYAAHSSQLFPSVSARGGSWGLQRWVRGQQTVVENPCVSSLRDLCASVGEGGAESTQVQLYSAYVAPGVHKGTTVPVERPRLVVVAVCFTCNGSIARIAGISSSKEKFKMNRR